jgi:hypothetical protein
MKPVTPIASTRITTPITLFNIKGEEEGTWLMGTTFKFIINQRKMPYKIAVMIFIF